MHESIYIVSLPSNHVEYLNSFPKKGEDRDIFFCSDPPNAKLGSGGGSVYAIMQARDKRKKLYHREIVINSDGESRRLPAYSVQGKVMMPLPGKVYKTLLDIQVETIDTFLESDTDGFYRTAISCGDVLLDLKQVPFIPHYDLLCIGVKGELEKASKHGVFIVSQNANIFSIPIQVLQKPLVQQLEVLQEKFEIAIDSGLWLLSQKASDLLFKSSRGKGRELNYFDLYSSFPDIIKRHKLSIGVMYDSSDSHFYHFGSSKDLLRSAKSLNLDIKGSCWIDSSELSDKWILKGDNILTHIPKEMKGWELPHGVCLDFLPLKNGLKCLRVYGIDDLFKGTAIEGASFVNAPLLELAGIASLSTTIDIYELPLFPCSEDIDVLAFVGEWLSQWHLYYLKSSNKEVLETYKKLPKIAAKELGCMTDFEELYRK